MVQCELFLSVNVSETLTGLLRLPSYHQDRLSYFINIHWLSEDFDWNRAGQAEGAILSCRMIILPSDVISA